MRLASREDHLGVRKRDEEPAAVRPGDALGDRPRCAACLSPSDHLDRPAADVRDARREAEAFGSVGRDRQQRVLQRRDPEIGKQGPCGLTADTLREPGCQRDDHCGDAHPTEQAHTHVCPRLAAGGRWVVPIRGPENYVYAPFLSVKTQMWLKPYHLPFFELSGECRPSSWPLPPPGRPE